MMQGFPYISTSKEEVVYVHQIRFKDEFLGIDDLVQVFENTKVIKVDQMKFVKGILHVYSEDSTISYPLEKVRKITHQWRAIKTIRDGKGYREGEKHYVYGGHKGKDSYITIQDQMNILVNDCKDITL